MRTIDVEKHAAQETRILDSARRLFAEKGYGETGVQDIAQAVGLTKAALYHYYPAKDRIFRAILDRRASERDVLVGKAACAVDMRQALEMLSDGFFEMVGRPEGRDILLILMSEGAKRSEVGDLFHRLVNRYMADFVEGAVRSGLIRPEEGERCRAELYVFLGALMHYVMDRTFHGKPSINLEEKPYSRFLSSMVVQGWRDIGDSRN